ncbi:hypothetical protein Tco_0294986 [Tanacetum coccineum]
MDDEDEEHPLLLTHQLFALPAGAWPHLGGDRALSIRDEEPISLPPREEVARLLLMPTPPSLPLFTLVSSPVPVLSPSSPASPIRPLSYRAAMIRLRAEATSTSYLLPLPPPIILSHTRPDTPSSGTPPLYLLSTNRRA